MLLMQIIWECISNTSHNKKMKDYRQKKLIREINELEECDTQDNHVLSLKKTELQNFRSAKSGRGFHTLKKSLN